ncbi:interaptin isoform X2 [Medicago truncatula]|uniref:interaptin isoform X2 n=1 Tax=Medicago truncatula TaxID=3880 RepID=UPI00196885D2|nr:interaptin isoform X2 [Medicago truncatula]
MVVRSSKRKKLLNLYDSKSDDDDDVPLRAKSLSTLNLGASSSSSSSKCDDSVENRHTRLPAKRPFDDNIPSQTSVKKSKLSSFSINLMKKSILGLRSVEEEKLQSLERDIEECSKELLNKKKQASDVRQTNQYYEEMQNKIEKGVKDLAANEEHVRFIKGLIKKKTLELKKNKRQLLAAMDSNNRGRGRLKEKELETLSQKIDECNEEIKTRKEELDALKISVSHKIKELMSERSNILNAMSERRTGQLVQMKDLESTKKQFEGRATEFDSKMKQCDRRIEGVESNEKLYEGRTKVSESKQEEFERQVKELESKKKQFESQEKVLGLKEKLFERQVDDLESFKEHFGSQLKGLKSKEKIFERRMKELKSKEEHFQRRVKVFGLRECDFEGQVKDFESKLKQYEGQVKELQSKKEEFEGRVEEFKSQEKDFESRVKGFESKEKDFESRVRKFESVEKDFESLVKKFESVEKDFESRVRKFESVEKDFESRVKKFESVEKDFESRVRKFESVEKDFEIRVRKFESVEKDFESRVRKFESVEKDFESRVRKFESKEEELELRDGQYETLIKSFEEEIESDDQPSPTIDGRSLQFLPIEEIDELESHGNDSLANLLASSSDPSKDVLDIIQNPIIPQCKGENVVIIDDHHIDLLEQLMRISPHVKPHVREEAMKLALKLKAYIGENTENPVPVLGFLLLLSIYGLVSSFDEDEILKLFGFAAQHKISVELFGTMGLAHKVSGYITWLSNV